LNHLKRLENDEEKERIKDGRDAKAKETSNRG